MAEFLVQFARDRVLVVRHLCEVGNVYDLKIEHRTPWRGAAHQRQGFGNLDAREVAVDRRLHQLLAFDQEDMRVARAADLGRARHHDVENRLEIGDRIADRAQDVGDRGLAIKRLPGFGEQAHILDRDHGLVGEGL